MEPIGPDMPSTSRRVRLAVIQNRVVEQDLKMALSRMEGERLRASQDHHVQRLKLLDDISTSTDAKTPDNEEPKRINHSRGTRRKIHVEGPQGRLLSREELSGPSKVHTEEPSHHGKSETNEVVKVECLLLGPQQEGHRRYTMGTTPNEILTSQNCRLSRRRRSVSMNDADLGGVMALRKQHQEDVWETRAIKAPGMIMDSVKPTPRPHSAMVSRAAGAEESGRSLSVDLDDILKTAKRNGVLDPISSRHGSHDCVTTAPSQHLKVDSRAYAKRHSEPHVVFNSRSILPVSPLSIDSNCNYNSATNSSDDSDTSPESDENQFPLNPYSIGNLCVRDCKGAFEQKTGHGGLRAWTGLSPKRKNRRLLHQRKKCDSNEQFHQH